MDYLATRILLVFNGFGMLVIYPINMLVLERASWVWCTPVRNMPMEHMLVAVYAVLGLHLLWAARDPLRYTPLIDFTILSGIAHGTVMAIDAVYYPGQLVHLQFRGDVMGTYIPPLTLALSHPRLLELVWRWRQSSS